MTFILILLSSCNVNVSIENDAFNGNPEEIEIALQAAKYIQDYDTSQLFSLFVADSVLRTSILFINTFSAIHDSLSRYSLPDTSNILASTKEGFWYEQPIQYNEYKLNTFYKSNKDSLSKYKIIFIFSKEVTPNKILSVGHSSNVPDFLE